MKKVLIKTGHYVLIDSEDVEKTSKYKWYIQKSPNTFYVRGYKDKKGVMMHRLIMGAQKGQVIDHINGNGLDNRKKNLRFADNVKNQGNRLLNINNTSGHRGVSWNKYNKRWDVRIRSRGVGKLMYFGGFKSKKDAVRVSRKALREYFGEFAATRQRT